MTDAEVEAEIVAKELDEPRVTPADIEAAIHSEHYFVAADAFNPTFIPVPFALYTLTFCVIVLKNGFTVTGQSAPVSPGNFDAEIGKKIARQNAIAQIWPLLGFRLRDKLHTELYSEDVDGD